MPFQSRLVGFLAGAAKVGSCGPFTGPPAVILAVCTVLYVIPRTAVLGAILLTAYLGGAVATHLSAGSPPFSNTLFGVYLGLAVWGGLWLRDSRVRALLPLRA